MSTEHNDIKIDMPFHSAGETIDVLASIRLAEVEVPPGTTPLAERHLRMRRVVVAPGGVIATHPHVNRPTILYVMTGTLLEFSVDRDHAVEHVAPAIVVPTSEHWWRNPGDETAEIIGVDLLDPAADLGQG